MSRIKILSIVGAAVLIGLGIVFAVSMDHDDSMSGKDVDGAFVSEMIPHHEGAVDMAELAQEMGQHPEIIELADNIVGTQNNEIATLNEIHDRLFGDAASSEAHGDLGIDDSMMGMDMDMTALETAEPFDREFIDQMVPHHQGAIRMARVEVQDGEDQEAISLANDIIDAQTTEILQMNAWRKKWYGAESPSGGVPPIDESVPEGDQAMQGMEH